jgi:8-oxo-dGTP pyrophosphatase MutT (NUDIX family)
LAIPPYVQGLRDRVGNDLLLLPAVSAVVFDSQGRVLLGKRTDNGRWALVGGILDPGEEPADAVVREVFEETAVVVEPVRVSGIYTSPEITYPNGGRSQYVVIGFACRHVSGEPRVNDDESTDVGFFTLDELPPLGVVPLYLERIEHALREEPTPWFALSDAMQGQDHGGSSIA